MRHPSPRLAGPGSPLSRVTATAAVGIFGALTGAGCAFEVDVGVETPNNQLVAVVPDTIRTELDLLFVVDDTEGMAAVHHELGDLWGRMRHHLEYAEGGFPDVRIGIITSDVGVGAAEVPGCTALGDNGALLQDALGNRFVSVTASDIDGPTEQLIERFRSIGESTCGFEQPLAAMQRAMDGDELQTTFLRDAAALGVVFVAGADDCSVTDPAFFSEGDQFRCFREGVVCGDDALAAGPQYGCRPRDSSMIASVADHSKLLLEMKDDPRAIAVGAVLGNPIEVRVLEDAGALSLAPACADAPGAPGALYPGVRLSAFAQDEHLKGSVADLCSQSVADAGSPTALDLRRALGHRCLEGKIEDVEPDEPGMQVECEVQAITGFAAPVELPPCANPNRVYESPGPCYAIKAGPAACGDFPSQLAVQVNWGGADPMTAPADTVTEVRCIVEDGRGPYDDPTNGLPD